MDYPVTEVHTIGFLQYEIGRTSILKKIAFSPMRNAFLLLVGLNFSSFAVKLYRAMKHDEKALKKKWEKLGGSYNALKKKVMKRINKRIKKGKSVSGINDIVEPYIGVAHLAAILAAAAPIITALSSFLKKQGNGNSSDYPVSE